MRKTNPRNLVHTFTTEQKNKREDDLTNIIYKYPYFLQLIFSGPAQLKRFITTELRNGSNFILTFLLP